MNAGKGFGEAPAPKAEQEAGEPQPGADGGEDEALSLPEPGAVVAVNLPGAPDMIVMEHLPTGDCRCCWFHEGEFKDMIFRRAILQIKPTAKKRGKK